VAGVAEVAVVAIADPPPKIVSPAVIRPWRGV